MKMMFLTAMLVASTAAAAQTADDQTRTDTTTTMQADVTTTTTTGTTSTMATGTQTGTTTMTGTTMSGGMTVAPGNNNPEVDARGIPVISDPAVAPAGSNRATAVPLGADVVVNPNQHTVFSTRPSTENYPPCSRTVTDNCVQTYERGTRR